MAAARAQKGHGSTSASRAPGLQLSMLVVPVLLLLCLWLVGISQFNCWLRPSQQAEDEPEPLSPAPSTNSDTIIIDANAHAPRQGCIVILHVGTQTRSKGIPVQENAQILDHVEQIRLFDSAIRVYLLVSDHLQFTAAQLARLQRANVKVSVASSVRLSPVHLQWQQHSAVVKDASKSSCWRFWRFFIDNSRTIFWRYALERWFYFSDFALQHNLTDIIHIEYDNLLYVNASSIIPALRRHYKMGAVCDNPDRCIPGILYFSSAKDALQLAQYMSQQATTRKTDMQLIAQYWKEWPDRIKPLPMFDPATYPDPVDPVLATHLQEFACIFDGAAYGQYLGGVDPRNIAGNTTGYVNDMSLVKPDKMEFEWRREGRLWVPYVNARRIANLHVHSKNTRRFRSDRINARRL